MSDTAIINDEVMRASGEDVADSIDSSATHPCSPGSAVGNAGSALSDAKRYRKRAQAAEKQLAEARSALDEQQRQLQEHQQKIASLEQRQQLDDLLIKAGAQDVEATRALAQHALAQHAMTKTPNSQESAVAGSAPDLAHIVEELRRTKPYLFRSMNAAPRSITGAMSATEINPRRTRQTQLDTAAEQALVSGRRIDLLRYLRLKRR